MAIRDSKGKRYGFLHEADETGVKIGLCLLCLGPIILLFFGIPELLSYPDST